MPRGINEKVIKKTIAYSRRPDRQQLLATRGANKEVIKKTNSLLSRAIYV
jgi:hypothetical protein